MSTFTEADVKKEMTEEEFIALVMKGMSCVECPAECRAYDECSQAFVAYYRDHYATKRPEPERTYRVGDVFEWVEANSFNTGTCYVIMRTDSQTIRLMHILGANRQEDGMSVNSSNGIHLSDIVKNPNEFRYIGYISELTIKNGRVVK